MKSRTATAKAKRLFSPENRAKKFQKGTNLHLEHRFMVQKLEHFGK
jgi:hypothetical protein